MILYLPPPQTLRSANCARSKAEREARATGNELEARRTMGALFPQKKERRLGTRQILYCYWNFLNTFTVPYLRLLVQL